MKRILKLRFGLVVLGVNAVIVAMLLPQVAYADVNNFTVTDFTADYYLTNTDPQGQMHVVEKIKVDFTDNNHGILRAIPASYKKQPLNVHINSVTSETGAPAQYTSSTQNDNDVLKIGDPNRTVTGNQEYTIDYTLQNVITFYGDHDELYWDVNGDQWNQPFTHVHATLHLPSGISVTNSPVCYTGPFGTTDHTDCTARQSAGEIIADAANLDAGFTLTFVVGFGKGYFHPVQLADLWHDYGLYAAEFVAPMVLIGGAGFLWWWRRGRDAKGTGIIIPQYDAPDNLSPLEVGTLVDFKVDNRDITATIIDLAIRKYLRIVEQDKRVLLSKTKQFSIDILKTDLSGLNQWESQLMGALVSEADNGSVSLSKQLPSLRVAVRAIKKSVDASLAERGYFVSSPYRYLALPLAAILVLVWVFTPSGITALTPGTFLGGGAAIGAMIFAVFYHFMPARTAKGVAANEYAQGLKLYLNVAEKDRLKMLQSPDAPYMQRASAPAQTVELFEKLLPYAIVFKVENEWAKKFESMYQTPPDWYSGNYGAFSAGYLAGSLGGNFGTAVATGFGVSGSASGSGFGGGGFAGGGGGGGGGGGW